MFHRTPVFAGIAAPSSKVNENGSRMLNFVLFHNPFGGAFTNQYKIPDPKKIIKIFFCLGNNSYRTSN
ncbi:hypothetical protein GCM10020331_054700 [Ectobacillus funiculus]